MKKLITGSLLAFLLVCASSCDKDFDEINTNTTQPTSLDPVLLFNNAVVNTSFSSRTVIYDMGIVQQMVTPNGGVLAGANFNIDSRDETIGSIWTAYYQNVIKYLNDVLVATSTLPAKSNLYNMARIHQAYVFMILTDDYGDIPYFEAGAGYNSNILYPKYDAQEVIYTDIITQLTEAAAALDASGAIVKEDVLYAGDIQKWKKYAYSLLLRAGMRLSKVDAAKAATTVQAAFAGGVITNNADNAYMRQDANYLQPIGNTLNGSEAANIYLAKPFVDYLAGTNDPRLSSIAIRYVGATSGTGQTVASGSTNPAVQIGMPIGYDNGTIVAKATSDGLASFYDYSQVDRRRMTKTTAPSFFVTASQTLLLLAEANFNGWITSGTAAQYFSDGIKAHMDQMATYDAASAVSPSAADPYIAANPLTAGNEKEQINTQYWISSFLNGPEAWANFRRSGFPLLTPNPYGQPNNPDVPAGTFINRLGYPTSELSVNSKNVAEAVARQGPEKISTKVWWDKP